MTDASPLIVRIDKSIARVFDPAKPEAYVCVDLAASSKVTLVFSDIVLTAGDTLFGVLALEALKDAGHLGSGVRVLRFPEIGPAHGSKSDHGETVWRHDQICEIARLYSERNSLRVTNTYLTLQADSLDTAIFLEPV